MVKYRYLHTKALGRINTPRRYTMKGWFMMPPDSITNPCFEFGCTAPIHARHLCIGHYHRWTRGQHVPGLIPRTLEERLWSNIDRNNPEGCWIWTGVTSNGYGQMRIDGKKTMAHRVTYEYFIGKIPAGLTIDHLCRNRACVNPQHLEPVTIRVNIMRGFSPHAINARKTHCLNGHEFNKENTYIRQSGRRRCLACKRERSKSAYHQNK